MNPMLNLWLIPILPLAGAAINGLLGKKSSRRAVTTIALVFSGAAFAMALWVTMRFSSLSLPYHENLAHWIRSGSFSVDFSFYLDQLSLVMLLVVTGVGFLIHIYSVGYMWDDPSYYRFFSYLNLFMFFMLTLVLADNYLLMFIGWEGVGLASYLLIGFWFTKDSAASAGKKAFIVNRIGDFGFLIALFLLIKHFGSLNFDRVFQSVLPLGAETAGAGLLTAIGILLMVGAAGKSAQIPLYVWLPDAMEGPTPVSALIHAATMVTAGVYMVARMNPLFSRAPIAMLAVAFVGGLTAFYSATIGLVQTDIKKVLAYSTVSQLGYMFLACGVGAYSAGIFHLMTHAFFKGLLFLAAGSVIHAMSGEQDMTKMGGLRKKIPVTYWTMFIATLAIAGIPGFAGFFSKDEILEAATTGPHANPWLWALGLIAAGLTSFYMFRLVFLTFFGKPRFDEHKVHVHESPRNMTIPLVILAFLSIFGGWFAAPKLLGGVDHFEAFLHPVFAAYAPQAVGGQGASLTGTAEARAETERAPAMELVHALTGPPVIVALAGLLVAWWFYIKRPETPKRLAQSLHGPYTPLLHQYYADELYLAVIVRPLLWVSTNVLWHVVDEGVIDGTVNGAATVAREAGGQLRQLQSGNARSYATWVVVGAVGFTVLLLGLWMVR